MKRYVSLTSLALASILLLSLVGCNKNDNSGGNSSGSSSGSSSSGSKSSTASNRFVGTWVDEQPDPRDPTARFRFTEDGKVSENCGLEHGEKQIGTYTVDGNKATIKPTEEWGRSYGNVPRTVTLESDNRMQLVGGGGPCIIVRGYLIRE